MAHFKRHVGSTYTLLFAFCAPVVADGVHVFPEQEIVIEAEEDSVDEAADEQAQR